MHLPPLTPHATGCACPSCDWTAADLTALTA